MRMRASLELRRSSSGFQIRRSSQSRPASPIRGEGPGGLFRSPFRCVLSFLGPLVRNTCSQAILRELKRHFLVPCKTGGAL